MKTYKPLRLTALLLALCLLLSGCSFRIDPPVLPEETRPETAPTETQTEATEETDGIQLPDDFNPADYPDAVDYSQIEYHRPDADAVCKQIDGVTALIEQGGSFQEIMDALSQMEASYNDFYTMDAVAYIEYCKNLSDEFFKAEYEYLEEQSPVLQRSMELLYTAAANCAHKEQLEDAYFGEDFLDFYLTHNIYTNDTFVALAQEESALQTEYMTLQDSQEVVIDGQRYDFDQLCEDYDGDYYTLYTEIYPAYYEQYNASCGEIFVKLVQTRQKMAEAAGYASYADYAYEYTYGRDYTPQMARDYVAQIRDTLVPLFFDVLTQSDAAYLEYGDMTMEEAAAALAESLYLMDADYYTYFRFMQYFNLWDASVSSSKMPGSYQTYLYSYEEPFVYISPEGTQRDYMTLAHEFGHFIDSMENDGMDGSIDQCEIFSQGLESLVLFYNNLPQDTVEELTRLKMLDALQVLLYQAAYADFEDRVYRQDGDTLTVDKINDIYEQVLAEYGLSAENMDWYNRQTWIDIMHFFVAPYYVISYCTSADAALQIYQLEDAQTGSGLAAYQELMDDTLEKNFVELLTDAGMESPFDKGRVEELAELFREWLLPSQPKGN